MGSILILGKDRMFVELLQIYLSGRGKVINIAGSIKGLFDAFLPPNNKPEWVVICEGLPYPKGFDMQIWEKVFGSSPPEKEFCIKTPPILTDWLVKHGVKVLYIYKLDKQPREDLELMLESMKEKGAELIAASSCMDVLANNIHAKTRPTHYEEPFAVS